MSARGLLEDLSARVPRQGPAWLAGLRGTAADALQSRGLPTPRHEAWRFTSLRGIVDRPFADAPAPAGGELPALRAWIDEMLGADHTARVLVAGGRPLLAGGPALPGGVELASLGDAPQPLLDATEPVLGHLARNEHFAALNTALFDDALIVRVSANARPAQPLHLVQVGQAADAATAAYPRLVILVEPGAELCLIETTLARPGAPQLANAVTEIAVGRGASVEHVRVHRGAPDAYQVAHVAVRQDQDSAYCSRVVTLGGALTRLDLDVTLAEPGARCRLDGVYHAGRGEHVDHYTTIDHRAPRCDSNERYRGIVDQTGHAVFDGTILVRPGAQHTSAHQENRNLLLADDAVVNTKPHLRIDADDVSCSHGATVGSLDDAQLFYLRARGVGEDQARAILTYAFVRELLDEVSHEPLARLLAAAVRARLPHGGTLEA